MIKKSEELEFLLDIQEHDRRTFWFKPLPWGCRMSLFFVLLTMEVYSAHGWRDLFFYRETKIYEETDQEKKRILSVDDPRAWEYLKAIRIAAERNKTSEEMIVLRCKDTIVQNLIHCWARDALESCPKKIKKPRSNSEEKRPRIVSNASSMTFKKKRRNSKRKSPNIKKF